MVRRGLEARINPVRSPGAIRHGEGREELRALEASNEKNFEVNGVMKD